MLLDLAGPWPHTDTLAAQGTVLDFRGVSSETGRLSDVLLCEPTHLEIVPCNEVSRDSIARGLRASPPRAARQHEALAAAPEAAGVRCHFVPPAPGHADLCFMRDAILIAPWALSSCVPPLCTAEASPLMSRPSCALWACPFWGGSMRVMSKAAMSACCAAASS